MDVWVDELGFKGWGLEDRGIVSYVCFTIKCARLFGVETLGFRVQDLGFRVKGVGCRVQGSGFRVQGSGFRH